ncbi:MAG: serine protease [Hyphomicrobiales bacterium]|nr:serine protease [Hyphomicrobiales bacterium]
MAASSSNPLHDVSAALTGLVAGVGASVVSIGTGRKRSSGFVWRSGLVVTADEALPDDDTFTVTLAGGETTEAKLVGRDSSTDIAVLRLDGGASEPISLVSPPASAGALAVAVGAAEGTPTAALGMVARATGAWRSMRGGEIDARIDLDMRLPPSAEGGLAVDADGQAIGMVVFGPRRRVLVIPAATIERVAAKLETHGRVPRAYIGVGLQPVAVSGGDGRGVMVMNLDPDGPGARAGLHQGDTIVAWNGEPVRHVRSMLRSLGPDSVGETVTLGLRRGGEAKDVTVTIGERPAD